MRNLVTTLVLRIHALENPDIAPGVLVSECDAHSSSVASEPPSELLSSASCSSRNPFQFHSTHAPPFFNSIHASTPVADAFQRRFSLPEASTSYSHHPYAFSRQYTEPLPPTVSELVRRGSTAGALSHEERYDLAKAQRDARQESIDGAMVDSWIADGEEQR